MNGMASALANPDMVLPTLVVMGVCGSGKTHLGSMLAQRLDAVFDDADDYHLPQNRAKLAAGEALTDEERKPWYALLRHRMEEVRGEGRRHILACSALSATLRAWLCGDDAPGSVVFILLEGSLETIEARMRARQGHFMPSSLLGSQFAKLEMTQDLMRVSNESEPDVVLENILVLLNQRLVQHSIPS